MRLFFLSFCPGLRSSVVCMMCIAASLCLCVCFMSAYVCRVISCLSIHLSICQSFYLPVVLPICMAYLPLPQPVSMLRTSDNHWVVTSAAVHAFIIPRTGLACPRICLSTFWPELCGLDLLRVVAASCPECIHHDPCPREKWWCLSDRVDGLVRLQCRWMDGWRTHANGAVDTRLVLTLPFLKLAPFVLGEANNGRILGGYLCGTRGRRLYNGDTFPVLGLDRQTSGPSLRDSCPCATHLRGSDDWRMCAAFLLNFFCIDGPGRFSVERVAVGFWLCVVDGSWRKRGREANEWLLSPPFSLFLAHACLAEGSRHSRT
ncbi:hypothetical protein B0T24DRAFT_372671 [Lasiosphaeria ovina]|uniref:Uncharacterized protein n=1 Tax=Lasiosphaeria ovina TaxID=92902 RepID=A0AAE0JZL4_9PEZI|nr:hypothetical protein B0T24DRAFT_372671 [Lasiosphaeria ovina]